MLVLNVFMWTLKRTYTGLKNTYVNLERVYVDFKTDIYGF